MAEASRAQQGLSPDIKLCALLSPSIRRGLERLSSPKAGSCQLQSHSGEGISLHLLSPCLPAAWFFPWIQLRAGVSLDNLVSLAPLSTLLIPGWGLWVGLTLPLPICKMGL